MPGERSIDPTTFRSAINAVQQKRDLGDCLRQKILRSQANIKSIKTGKGLMEAFMETDNISDQGSKQEGLPVFSDKNYVNNL